MPKVCIGVCTAKRPKMLRNCLASLAVQAVPEDIAITIVVVDNEAQPNNQATVEEFARQCPFQLVYSHQPDPGIPQARNRALEEALTLGADWIAFIDDDETAEPDWLAQLLAAAERHQADVVQGEVEFVFPRPLPFWAQPGRKFSRLERRNRVELGLASTCNVLFRASLAQRLRFDEARRFLGSDDVDFFRRAKASGAKIVYTPKALVSEEIPPSRSTYLYQIRRSYNVASGTALYIMQQHGRLAAYRKLSSRSLRSFLSGLLLALVFPFAPSKRGALAIGRKLTQSLAYAKAPFSKKPIEVYRQIHGY